MGQEVRRDGGRLEKYRSAFKRLEYDAWRPRLAMEADRPANTKTRERTEGAATAVQAKYGDSFSASRVDSGSKTNSSSFDMKAEPPALPCRDDVLVENGGATPESCLPSLEMCSPTAAGGLLPTGEAPIATRSTFNQPPLWLSAEEKNCKKTSTPYVSYDSSFFQKSNLPAASSCRRVVRDKIRRKQDVRSWRFKVVSAPARFGGRGARCFVGRFMLGQRCFKYPKDWGINLQEK